MRLGGTGRKWNDDAKHPMIRVDLRFTPEDFDRCKKVVFENHPHSYFEHWCAHACLFFAWYEERQSELLRQEYERQEKERKRRDERQKAIYRRLEELEGPAVAARLLSELTTFDHVSHVGDAPRDRRQYRKPKRAKP